MNTPSPDADARPPVSMHDGHRINIDPSQLHPNNITLRFENRAEGLYVHFQDKDGTAREAQLLKTGEKFNKDVVHIGDQTGIDANIKQTVTLEGLEALQSYTQQNKLDIFMGAVPTTRINAVELRHVSHFDGFTFGNADTVLDIIRPEKSLLSMAVKYEPTGGSTVQTKHFYFGDGKGSVAEREGCKVDCQWTYNGKKTPDYKDAIAAGAKETDYAGRSNKIRELHKEQLDIDYFYIDYVGNASHKKEFDAFITARIPGAGNANTSPSAPPPPLGNTPSWTGVASALIPNDVPFSAPIKALAALAPESLSALAASVPGLIVNIPATSAPTPSLKDELAKKLSDFLDPHKALVNSYDTSQLIIPANFDARAHASGRAIEISGAYETMLNENETKNASGIIDAHLSGYFGEKYRERIATYAEEAAKKPTRAEALEYLSEQLIGKEFAQDKRKPEVIAAQKKELSKLLDKEIGRSLQWAQPDPAVSNTPATHSSKPGAAAASTAQEEDEAAKKKKKDAEKPAWQNFFENNQGMSIFGIIGTIIGFLMGGMGGALVGGIMGGGMGAAQDGKKGFFGLDFAGKPGKDGHKPQPHKPHGHVQHRQRGHNPYGRRTVQNETEAPGDMQTAMRAADVAMGGANTGNINLDPAATPAVVRPQVLRDGSAELQV